MARWALSCGFGDRQGQNAGLIVRVDRAGHRGGPVFRLRSLARPARQILSLARHRNNFEPIKDVKCEVAIGRWIPLEVKLDGSRIEILVDGKSVLSHDDGDKALPAGTFGLRGWHCQASFRNLWVKSGEEIEPVAFRHAEPRHGNQRHVAAGANRRRGRRIRPREGGTRLRSPVAGNHLSLPAMGVSGSRTRGSIAGA